MDTALYQTNLSALLGDPTNTVFTTSAVQTFMCIAVRAYRRWRQCLRQFGSGVTYSSAAASQAVVQACGGPFVAGQTITIADQFNSETKVILSLAAGTSIANWMGVPIAITLTTNLAHTYAAGTRITVASPSTPGLALAAGQQTYRLPTDFVSFERETWDLANGQRLCVKNYESFYDGVYTYSQLLSGVGWGQAQTFMGAAGFPNLSSPIAGIPNATNAFSLVNTSNPDQYVFQVQPGNPPVLLVAPTPIVAQTWQFSYYAAHQPETIPDEDFDALLDAGRAAAYASRLSKLGQQFDWSDAGASESRTPMVNAMMEAAAKVMEDFDKKIRLRPYMVTG